MFGSKAEGRNCGGFCSHLNHLGHSQGTLPVLGSRVSRFWWAASPALAALPTARAMESLTKKIWVGEITWCVLAVEIGGIFLWNVALISGNGSLQPGNVPGPALKVQQSPCMEAKVSFSLRAHPFMSSSSSGWAGGGIAWALFSLKHEPSIPTKHSSQDCAPQSCCCPFHVQGTNPDPFHCFSSMLELWAGRWWHQFYGLLCEICL